MHNGSDRKLIWVGESGEGLVVATGRPQGATSGRDGFAGLGSRHGGGRWWVSGDNLSIDLASACRIIQMALTGNACRARPFGCSKGFHDLH